MDFFHGTTRNRLEYDPAKGQSDDPDMFFASACPLVARFYGENLFRVLFTGDVEVLPRVTIRRWLTGGDVPESSFIISGDPEHEDFPVDTLVVRSGQDVVIAAA
jgi:hypothetical protein